MAWTDPRTWTTNELVTAAIMNTHVRDNFLATVRNVPKTADETVTSSTVLQNDDHLLFAMAANEYYAVQGGLWHSNATAAVHIKIAFTVPASATYMILGEGIQTDGATFIPQNHRSSADTSSYFTGSTGNYSTFRGTVVCAGTPGNLQLQWAQVNSNASGTVLKKGSWMMVSKLG